MTLENIKLIVEIVVPIIQTVGFVIAGIWTYFTFRKKREGKPKIIIEHTISHHQISVGKRTYLLSVNIKIQNTGNCLAEFEKVDTWIQQIIPAHDSLLETITSHENGSPYQQEIDSSSWWLVGRKLNELTNKKPLVVLEPQESQSLCNHFLITDDVKTVLVTTHLWGYGTSKISEDGRLEWSHPTIYDFKK